MTAPAEGPPSTEIGRDLRLAPYDANDESVFVRWFMDPGFTRYIGGPHTDSDARTLFHAIRTGSHTTVQRAFSIRAGTTLIGHVAVLAADRPDTVEFTYGLSPTHWGRGLGRNAARQALHAARRMAQNVVATVDLENTVSVHILRSLGGKETPRCDEDGPYLQFDFAPLGDGPHEAT